MGERFLFFVPEAAPFSKSIISLGRSKTFAGTGSGAQNVGGSGVAVMNPFRSAVPFWGRNTRN